MHSAIDAPCIMAKSFGFANTTPFSATAVHDTVAENEANQSWCHPINHQLYNYNGIKPGSLDT